MTSRRYIKRVWRVPKTRGAAEAFGWLVVKALRKHGWPADLLIEPHGPWPCSVVHKFDGHDFPEDFAEQVDIAFRIAQRTYRVEIDRYKGGFEFVRPYVVTSTGHFVPWDKWWANHRKTARNRVTP